MYKKWNTNGIKLLTTALREDDTSFPAISNMNVEGQPEHFHRQALQSAESAAGSSEGGGAAATCSMSFSFGTTLGLTYVSAAGAAQFTAKASARAASARANSADSVATHSDLNQVIVIN